MFSLDFKEFVSFIWKSHQIWNTTLAESICLCSDYMAGLLWYFFLTLAMYAAEIWLHAHISHSFEVKASCACIMARNSESHMAWNNQKLSWNNSCHLWCLSLCFLSFGNYFHSLAMSWPGHRSLGNHCIWGIRICPQRLQSFKTFMLFSRLGWNAASRCYWCIVMVVIKVMVTKSRRWTCLRHW